METKKLTAYDHVVVIGNILVLLAFWILFALSSYYERQSLSLRISSVEMERSTMEKRLKRYKISQNKTTNNVIGEKNIWSYDDPYLGSLTVFSNTFWVKVTNSFGWHAAGGGWEPLTEDENWLWLTEGKLKVFCYPEINESKRSMK